MNIFYRYHQDLINNQIKTNISKMIECSFEFFPPKNNTLEKNLWDSVKCLKGFNPLFFSVTYGANSGEREKTYDIVKKIYYKTGIITAPHLTCIDATYDELKNIAQQYWKDGVSHVIALRGDSLNKNYENKMYALDLVILLKKIANFDISVAAYPEVHPEAESATSDIINLKKKIDAGANRAITQFFFNVESYLRFRDKCVKYDINTDLIPGIFPISNFNQLYKFSKITNVCIPQWMCEAFHSLENDQEQQKILGSRIALDMINSLFREGVRKFHFYTLNQSDIIYSIFHILGL